MGFFKTFFYRFRVPDFFQTVTFIFLLLYWVNLIMKLVFESYYNSIVIREKEYLDISQIETFQFVIFFFDYLMALSMALVMVCYINGWLKPLNFIVSYVGKFMVSFFPYITLLILVATLVTSLFLRMIFGMHLKGSEEYIQSFLTSWLMLTRGPMFYSYAHNLLNEDFRYLTESVNLSLLLFMVVIFHFVLRYFLINL